MNGRRFVNTSLTTLGDGRQVIIIVDFDDRSSKESHHLAPFSIKFFDLFLSKSLTNN